MKKSDAFGLLFSSGRKTNSSSQNRNLSSARKSTARRTTVLFTPSSLSAERNHGFQSTSKSSSSRKTMSNAQNIINNKELQHAATVKIRNYFRRRPEFCSFPLYGQQPLTTKCFIEMVDFLFGLLLKTNTFIQQNYLEQIPIHMKHLGYQGNVQKSWLQVVNTASALPHVTGLLAFLVDLVDWQDDALTMDLLFPPPEVEDDDDKTNILKNCLAHELDSFEIWNRCEEESTSLTEEKEEMDRLGRKLIEGLNINEDDIKFAEQEMAWMESELNEKSYVLLLNGVEETQNMCHGLKNDEETMSLELKKMQGIVKSTENERNEKEKKIQSLEHFSVKKKNEVTVLKQQCAKQKITVEDRQNIIKKCKELKDSIKCYEDYLKTAKETVFQEDIAIAQLRQGVNNSCLAYNKLLMEPGNQFEEINHVRLPPNIFQYDPEEVSVTRVLRTIFNESELKKNELEAELKSVESKTLEVEGKFGSIFYVIQDREAEKTILKDQLVVQREEMDQLRKECTENERDIVAEICSLNKVLASCKERLEELSSLKKLNKENAVMIENEEKERQAILDNFTRQGYILLNIFMVRCHEAMDSLRKRRE